MYKNNSEDDSSSLQKAHSRMQFLSIKSAEIVFPKIHNNLALHRNTSTVFMLILTIPKGIIILKCFPV